MSAEYDVLIIGAGTAGIMTAAMLHRRDATKSIAIIDPTDTHYYQPAWTLVGAGTYDYNKTGRPMDTVIPSGVTWIKDKAVEIIPEDNAVATEEHGLVRYNALVVAPGLVMEPGMIDGLSEALEARIAVSNYTDPEETWRQLQKFKGGNALFTQPNTPIKCGGAPQKIAYLAADYLRKNKLLDKSNVIFATPGSVIFGISEIRKTLEEVIERYGMVFKPFYNPVKIDIDRKEVHFKSTNPAPIKSDDTVNQQIHQTSTTDGTYVIPFDFLHIAPPQAAPRFIRESSLSNDAGWLDVDHHSMVHKDYHNVYGLGDVAALPTAKTGAAIRKQVPIVVNNVLSYLKGGGVVDQSYNGYSSCPLVTAYGKMVLAEFDYKNNFTPDPMLKRMLVFDSSKEHWRLWLLKKYGLPYLYWNKMLKGIKV